MNTEAHNPNNRHGDFERRDISAAAVVYFFVGLAAAAIVIHLLLAGFYDFLDKRNNAQQAPMSPLIANVPVDTRHIPKQYEDKAFPEPRLENDERNQFTKIRLNEERLLNSYGWVDEKSKTVRIPIERAMDLVAQRGLPVRPPAAASQSATVKQKGNMQ